MCALSTITPLLPPNANEPCQESNMNPIPQGDGSDEGNHKIRHALLRGYIPVSGVRDRFYLNDMNEFRKENKISGGRLKDECPVANELIVQLSAISGVDTNDHEFRQKLKIFREELVEKRSNTVTGGGISFPVHADPVQSIEEVVHLKPTNSGVTPIERSPPTVQTTALDDGYAHNLQLQCQPSFLQYHIDQNTHLLQSSNVCTQPTELLHKPTNTCPVLEMQDTYQQSTVHNQNSDKTLIHTTPSLSISCCYKDLNEADVPTNPLDDVTQESTLFKKEIAWLVEETYFLLPSLAKEKNLMLFDIAWLFGSVQLRQILFQKHPNLLADKIHNAKNRSNATIVLDARQLLSDETNDTLFEELRNDAREALNIGYRRSDRLGYILNSVRQFRLRRALEEEGDHQDKRIDSLIVRRMRRNRRRRMKPDNHIDIMTNLSSNEIEKIASEKPVDLNEIEEEIAWLCEESLLLLPKRTSTSNGTGHYTLSTGLVTQAPDVNWEYVMKNATSTLKGVLQKLRGDVSNRSLQHVVRNSNVHVKMAFCQRREQIANLITIEGYRRIETKNALPSDEELIQSGFRDILKTKLIRRIQHRSRTEKVASIHDLRLACNQRLKFNTCVPAEKKRKFNKRSPSKLKRRKRLADPPLRMDSEKAGRLSNSRHMSSLTRNEEELAWLRVECEIETGLKGYNWEYIEEYASPHLQEEMLIRGVLFSVFPTSKGISRLKNMVRLGDKKVCDAYHLMLRNIRCSIKNGFRRDRSSDKLPCLPHVPSSIAGTKVFNVEYATCDGRVNGYENYTKTGVGYSSNNDSLWSIILEISNNLNRVQTSPSQEKNIPSIAVNSIRGMGSPAISFEFVHHGPLGASI